MILLPIAPRAADFDWRPEAAQLWARWNGRFSLALRQPALAVRIAPVASLLGSRGRFRPGAIEINEALAPAHRSAALRHELAHAFLDAKCPLVTRPGALLSEVFALHVTGEALSLPTARFPYVSSARDHVLRLSPASATDRARDQEALSRILSLPGQSESWDKYFKTLLDDCERPNFSLARAIEIFQARVRGRELPPVPVSVDFMLVDGLSQETLVREGKPDRKTPTGSLLKPTFFGLVPGLLDKRVAENTALWDCPNRRVPGQVWTWEMALLKSCNGFFVGADREQLSWERWNETLTSLQIGPLPRTMEERIGLTPRVLLNLPEAIRVFAWLSRTNPTVLSTLKRTAVEGTLSGLPDSAWFASRGIALKTGTVSDLRGVAHHAWIAAVGPKEPGGEPAYFAVIRGSGVSTHELLAKLKDRLQRWKYPSRPMEVQVLGLIPSLSLSLGCRSGGPLLERDASGLSTLRPGAVWLSSTDLKEGHAYVCPGDALRFKHPGGTRDYWGSVRLTEKLAEEIPGELPKGPRAARARQGSRLILKTSERHYVVDTLLSEFPTGHTELLRALALVVRHNARVPRHGDRPLCDTTHCQTFGRGGDAPLALRRRIEGIVEATADKTLSADAKSWLPFQLGGFEGWSAKRNEGEIRIGLNVRERLREILKTDDGAIELRSDSGKRKLACETVRNQLKLLSCPDSVASVQDGWVFRGQGQGHGMGLDLTVGNVRAGAGETHGAILSHFYPTLRVLPSGG